MTVATNDFCLPISNLDAFISNAQRFPMLSKETEYELACALRDEGDLAAARQLVLSHMRFVIRIARGYLGYGLPLGDLIQEGNIGLMKAVKRFDPEQGVRLVSFAVHWIKAEIHEFVIRNWRIVKVATTKAQRKLFFNLRNSKQRLGWFTQEEVSAVAAALNVSTKEVLEMENRLNSVDSSYDGLFNSSDEEYRAPANTLPADHADPALLVVSQDTKENNLDQLSTAMAQLDERSQAILRARWLDEDNKETLQSLAARFNVSAERIRQLEKIALEKLKAQLVPAH